MISIIIPTLNEEKIIGTTLAKLSAGLKMPHEIIVSDGKSTDKTAEIAGKYAQVIVLKYTGIKRQTIAMGRNAGAKAAKGDFILFFDADCSLPDPEKALQYGLDQFAKNPHLTGLVPYLTIIPENTTLFDKFMSWVLNLYYVFSNNILNLPVSGGEFQMMRKSDFEKIGGYREDLVASEDYDLLRRLGQIGQTRLAWNLVVWHTGRRIHKQGWFKLMSLWSLNTLSYWIRKKAVSDEWTVVR